jgi:hypothetical protein
MPGFAASFVVTASSASQGIKAHADDRRYQFHGNKPNVSRNDVGNEEVDIVGAVGQIFIAAATVATGGAVSVTAAEGIGGGHRFHLDSPQTLARISASEIR